MISLLGFAGMLTAQVKSVEAVSGKGGEVLPIMIGKRPSRTANPPDLFNRESRVVVVRVWVVVLQRNPLEDGLSTLK